MNAVGGPETWAEVWEHVKSQRPEQRAVPPLGPLQEDGGRLVLLRRRSAVDHRESLVYLEASGTFVEVKHEDTMSGRVELVDGRVIG